MHGFGALFGALLGFFAAIAPELIQMLKDKFSHARELEVRQQELDAAAKGYEYAIHNQADILAAQAAQIETLQAQVSDAEDVKGHIVLQFLRSSVRPIITYGFFALFCVVKISALHHGIEYGTPLDQLVNVIWDEDSESLFAAVISFWFGSRGINVGTPKVKMDSRPSSNLKGTGRVVGE
jgi:hypothetical protein